MKGKGGNLCDHARMGRVHCPLIVRPNSEDVITGHLVQALRTLNPRWWLSDLLNAAVGADRSRRQVYRRLRIEAWVNMPPYPRALLPWAEGSTQVDLVITFENPPTTVFVEAKYLSKVSATTAHGDGTHGYPADQILRNIRVGLLACGYFDEGPSLFDQPRRDFLQVLLAPRKGHPLIDRYRDPGGIRSSVPHPDRLVALPRAPFVGELAYGDITKILARNARFLTRAERRVSEDLTAYLEFKQPRVPSPTETSRPPERAADLPKPPI